MPIVSLGAILGGLHVRSKTIAWANLIILFVGQIYCYERKKIFNISNITLCNGPEKFPWYLNKKSILVKVKMGSGQICFLLCLFLPQDRGLAVKRLSLIRLLALHNVLHNYQWTCFAPHFTWYERVLLEMGNSSCFNKTSRFGRMNKTLQLYLSKQISTL